MLLALVVGAYVPELAILAAVQVRAAVGAQIGSLHLDLKNYFVVALVAEMVLFLDLWNVH